MKFSFTGQALHWFDSYLRPRGFQVIIEEQRSDIINLPFSVAQGSCGGPTYYSVYASTLQECIMDDLKFDLHAFADDHACKKLFDANSRLQEYKKMCDLTHCVREIKIWMDQNRLKMNDSKTEYIFFGLKWQLAKCITTELRCKWKQHSENRMYSILRRVDRPTLILQNPHPDKNANQLPSTSSDCAKFIVYLPEKQQNLLAHALVISHLDYANATLNGLPDCDINKMQRIQNMAAKMVLRVHKYSSPMECMKELHWLPIQIQNLTQSTDFGLQNFEWWCPRIYESHVKGTHPIQRVVLDQNSHIKCYAYHVHIDKPLPQDPSMWQAQPIGMHCQKI